MWHKQSFTQFWSQSDAYSRRSSLKLTYIHHPLVVCTHQICCAVAVPIALSQDRLLHGHNRLVNWTPCSRMREQAKKNKVAILPISTRPVLLKKCSVVRLWAFSEGDVENHWSVTRCHLKVLWRIRESNSLPLELRWHLLKTITSTEDHSLLCIMRQTRFSLSAQDQGEADQTN